MRNLADEARRLPPPDRRNPHAFQEARDELAPRISELANFLSGKFTLARSEPKAAIKPGPIRSAKGKVVTVEFRDPKRV
ncbi:hypothetical protein BB934_34980 (plasmid) [Microvirga ossetica]|uniref:Uncharacterized protein n=1 Tax=Microvirga ossetica TaxID=1882682 RepID=A0A1B2EU26_9HYPH|nr:hypothetical protein BB934_34980 [Microvirga ossetica]